jgi:hypothetical protein
MVKVLFKEQQRFSQWWIWVIIAGNIGLFGYLLYLFYGTAQPVEDAPPQWVMLIFCLIPVWLVFLFLSMRLITEIRKEGIYFMYRPFHRKKRFYAWEEIDRCYVRKYRPILEYGGWGIRAGTGKYGKAFNVSGNIGLQLELKNGKKILIGTHKPRELERELSKLETPQ